MREKYISIKYINLVYDTDFFYMFIQVAIEEILTDGYININLGRFPTLSYISRHKLKIFASIRYTIGNVTPEFVKKKLSFAENEQIQLLHIRLRIESSVCMHCTIAQEHVLYF